MPSADVSLLRRSAGSQSRRFRLRWGASSACSRGGSRALMPTCSPAAPYAAAARFFLDELYSDKDYADRDAQFARIAGAIEKLFPAQVARTASNWPNCMR